MLIYVVITTRSYDVLKKRLFFMPPWVVILDAVDAECFLQLLCFALITRQLYHIINLIVLRAWLIWLNSFSWFPLLWNELRMAPGCLCSKILIRFQLYLERVEAPEHCLKPKASNNKEREVKSLFIINVTVTFPRSWDYQVVKFNSVLIC